MDVVNQYGLALSHVSYGILGDKEILLEAVRDDVRDFQFLPWSFGATVMFFLRQRRITALHYIMQI